MTTTQSNCSIEWTLTEDQTKKIPETLTELGEKKFRSARENCTSFGADFVERVTGDRLPHHHSHELHGEIPSPAVLQQSMREFERNRNGDVEKEVAEGPDKSTQSKVDLPTPPLKRTFNEIAAPPDVSGPDKSDGRDR